MRFVSSLILLLLGLAPAFAQNPPLTCQVTAPVPNLVDVKGDSELTSDVLIICTGGDPGHPTLFNFTLFLNTAFTTKIMNPVTGETESLLLIDEPQPGVPNPSNNCPPYAGQVLGTPGAPACSATSGNVYQATTVSSGGGLLENVVQWLGVPFEPPGIAGTRVIRLTNVRAAASEIGIPGASVMALVAMSGASAVTLVQPGGGTAVATMLDGLVFASTAPAAGVLKLDFQEGFAQSFKKRIENISAPLDALHQDVPGAFYCTESGFTPQFSAVTAGAIGSADTGTRLLAKFSSLPPAAFLLLVPNEVTSSSGQLVAHRVFPPFAADFTGGAIPLVGGDSLAFVSGHSAEVLYEVTAASPFHAVNGCALLESFNFTVRSFFPVSLATAVASGSIVPTDPDPFPTPSATSPRPRFKP